MVKILLVEDDPAIARLVRRGLTDAGYTVEVASDGVTGLEMAQTGVYHVLLVDVMLPGKDGWQIVDALRSANSRVPVLMLTARDATEDRVRGLDAGADDYLPKPFAFPELLARIRALLRRDKMHRTRVVRVADLEIDTAARLVTRAGVPVDLSRREFDLLEALALHEGRVLTRDAVHDRIWMDEDTYSNTVDAYIKLLRRKVDTGHAVKLIHTVRGVGYTLRVPDGNGER